MDYMEVEHEAHKVHAKNQQKLVLQKKVEKQGNIIKRQTEDLRKRLPGLGSAPSIAYLLKMLALILNYAPDINISNLQDDAPFKYIKHPSSLRCSMRQLIHEITLVFIFAQSSMNNIRIQLTNVPSLFGKCMEALANPDDDCSQTIVTTSLAKLEQIANLCADLSKKNANKVEDVLQHVLEVIQAVTMAQSTNKREVESNKKMLQELENRMNACEEHHRELEENSKQQKDNVREAYKQYEKNMKKLGGSGMMILRRLADTVCDTVTNVVSLPKDAFAGIADIFHGKNDKYMDAEKAKAARGLIAALTKIAEEARENNLRQAEIHERMRKEEFESRDNILKLAAAMENINLEKVDMSEIIEFLNQGLQLLTSVQESWYNISLFFTSFMTVVEGPMTESLKSFVEYAPKSTKSRLANKEMFEGAVKCCVVAHQLSSCGLILGDVCDEFVMPTMTSISQYIGMNKEEAQKKLETAKKELHQLETNVAQFIEDKHLELLCESGEMQQDFMEALEWTE